MKFASIILIALLLNACAHSGMRGGVAMKTTENEAHVCLGDREAKVGDRVTAFTNICPPRGGRPSDGGARDVTCEKRKIGEGTVTALLNEHYSVVKFDDGVQFDEGTFVEKR